jgi:hypothetical protein
MRQIESDNEDTRVELDPATGYHYHYRKDYIYKGGENEYSLILIYVSPNS